MGGDINKTSQANSSNRKRVLRSELSPDTPPICRNDVPRETLHSAYEHQTRYKAKQNDSPPQFETFASRETAKFEEEDRGRIYYQPRFVKNEAETSIPEVRIDDPPVVHRTKPSFYKQKIENLRATLRDIKEKIKDNDSFESKRQDYGTLKCANLHGLMSDREYNNELEDTCKKSAEKTKEEIYQQEILKLQ